MPINATPVPVSFPLGGIAESAPYAAQPGQTAVRPDHLLNMRAYDSIEQRNRGGQRSGMSKQASSAINGSNAIQTIETIVEAQDLVQSASWGDKLTDPAGPLSGSDGKVLWASDASFIVQMTTGAGIRVWPVTGNTYGTGITLAHSTITSALGSGNVNDIALSSNNDYLFIATDGGLGVCTIDPSSGFGSITEFGTLSNVAGVEASSDGAAVVYCDQTGTAVHAVRWTGTAFGTAFADPGVGQLGSTTLALANDDSVVISTNNSGTGAVAAWNFSPSTGFGSQIDTQNIGTAGGNVNDLAIHPSLSHVSIALGTSNQYQVYPFSTSTGFGTVAAANAGVGTLEATSFSPSGDYLFFGGGTSPRGKVFSFAGSVGSALANPGTLPTTTAYSGQWSASDDILALSVTNVVETWDFVPAGINPSARETRLVVVSGGSVYRSNLALNSFSVVGSGTSALNPSAPFILADTNLQNLFFADGVFANYQYLDFSDNTLKDWTAALTAGALPRGTTDTTLGCNIVATFRGRTVLSGLREEPQNWFMSRVGDAFDFNYSPSTSSATQPVAGNNSDAGEVGDIITALAPFRDDVLIMGCANTIWVMQGDPAAGGRIDNVSRNIGVVGPQAWCFDNAGVFYFFGINGLYRMAPQGGTPQLVSRNKLDKTFNDIDITTKIIRLAYDPKWQGVAIFISDTAQPTTPPDCYFYDERNDAFWRDQYPAAVGPSAVGVLQDANPENNNILVGGFDSFLRRFDDNATNDDGTAIDSFVRFPAMHPGLTMGQFQLSDLQLHTDADASGATLDIFRGNTPEEAATATATAYTQAIAAGRNLPIRYRLRGNAIQLRLRNNTLGQRWAYEQGTALLAGVGRQRSSL